MVYIFIFFLCNNIPHLIRPDFIIKSTEPGKAGRIEKEYSKIFVNYLLFRIII